MCRKQLVFPPSSDKDIYIFLQTTKHVKLVITFSGQTLWLARYKRIPKEKLNNIIIINWRCPADATDDAFTLTTNRESNKVVFSVKSFTWTSIDKDSQLIYIHCEVRVYDDTTLTDHGYTAVVSLFIFLMWCKDENFGKENNWNLSNSLALDDNVIINITVEILKSTEKRLLKFIGVNFKPVTTST